MVSGLRNITSCRNDLCAKSRPGGSSEWIPRAHWCTDRSGVPCRGRNTPGQRIDPAKLAPEFKTSPTPVRFEPPPEAPILERLDQWNPPKKEVPDVLAGGSRASRSDGVRAPSRARLAVGRVRIDRRQDRLYGPNYCAAGCGRLSVTAGLRPGTASEELARIKAMEREVHELRQANETYARPRWVADEQ